MKTWTNRSRRTFVKRSSKSVTGVGQSCSVMITNRPGSSCGPNSKLGIIFLSRARKQLKYCTDWAKATCCREWTFCLTSVQAQFFPKQIGMIRSASGARRQRTTRRIKIRLAPTPHRRVRKGRDHRVASGTFRNHIRVKFSKNESPFGRK